MLPPGRVVFLAKDPPAFCVLRQDQRIAAPDDRLQQFGVVVRAIGRVFQRPGGPQRVNHALVSGNPEPRAKVPTGLVLALQYLGNRLHQIGQKLLLEVPRRRTDRPSVANGGNRQEDRKEAKASSHSQTYRWVELTRRHHSGPLVPAPQRKLFLRYFRWNGRNGVPQPSAHIAVAPPETPRSTSYRG